MRKQKRAFKHFSFFVIFLCMTIVICIARLRNPTLTNREKNCRQDNCRQDNLEVVKGFRSQGVLNILCATRKFVIIK
jgi:hypothetical protein